MRVVMFHSGGNFRRAAETLAQEMRSAGQAQHETITVELYRAETADQVRQALLAGRIDGGRGERAEPVDRIEFFTHSGPHVIFLSDESGAEHNLAAGRTCLNRRGDFRYQSTPYGEVFGNLASDAIINVHGCNFGTAAHGQRAGAQELADATGAAVTGYVGSGSNFTDDVALSTGARPVTQGDFTAPVGRAGSVWMFPGRPSAGGWKTFRPRGSSVLPAEGTGSAGGGGQQPDSLVEQPAQGSGPSARVAGDLLEAAEQAALETVMSAQGGLMQQAQTAARQAATGWSSALQEALEMAESEAGRAAAGSLTRGAVVGWSADLQDALALAEAEAGTAVHPPGLDTVQRDYRELLDAASDAALEAARVSSPSGVPREVWREIAQPEPQAVDLERLGQEVGRAVAQAPVGFGPDIDVGAQEGRYGAPASIPPPPNLLEQLGSQFGSDVGPAAGESLVAAAHQAAFDAQGSWAGALVDEAREAALDRMRSYEERAAGSVEGSLFATLPIDQWADVAAQQACGQLFDWNAQRSAAAVHDESFGHDLGLEDEAMEAQQQLNRLWRP